MIWLTICKSTSYLMKDDCPHPSPSFIANNSMQYYNETDERRWKLCRTYVNLISQCHIIPHIADYQLLKLWHYSCVIFTIVTRCDAWHLMTMPLAIMSPRNAVVINGLRHIVTLWCYNLWVKSFSGCNMPVHWAPVCHLSQCKMAPNTMQNVAYHTAKGGISYCKKPLIRS